MAAVPINRVAFLIIIHLLSLCRNRIDLLLIFFNKNSSLAIGSLIEKPKTAWQILKPSAVVLVFLCDPGRNRTPAQGFSNILRWIDFASILKACATSFNLS
jgi:hypothetical protein